MESDNYYLLTDCRIDCKYDKGTVTSKLEASGCTLLMPCFQKQQELPLPLEADLEDYEIEQIRRRVS